ncbi:hypothetical protein PC117_g5289 [Phytophthora cactorum]|uniref:Uncharacterized protein n=1 Tax=Phytophthora cactorum TaxID=29920 RepID=A0A8T1E4X4_9STRA|nr:hypothetical protein PC117_g5289 [Phytophthora cactorum]
MAKIFKGLMNAATHEDARRVGHRPDAHEAHQQQSLDALCTFQYADFEDIFRAMDGLPVMIRMRYPLLQSSCRIMGLRGCRDGVAHSASIM